MEGYYTITLEDLLAGAFLAININQNRFLSYSKLSDYEKKSWGVYETKWL